MKFFRKLFARSHYQESLNCEPNTVQSTSHGPAVLRLVEMPHSSTPLTDLEIKRWLQTGPVEKVSAEFARNLERKLNEYHRNNGINQVADGKASG